MKNSNQPLSLDYGKEEGVLVQYMDWLHEVRGAQKQTAYNYYMALRTLAKFLAHRRKNMECDPDEVVLREVSAHDMLTITKDEWWDYLDYCQFQQGDTKGSLAVKISIVRGFYRWLAAQSDQTFMATHIIATVRPKSAKSDFIMVTEEMEDALCEQLGGDNELRNICIVRMFLRCGLGLQEICNLDLEDVEVASLRVRAVRGDTRVVPLDETMVSVLDSYIAVRTPPTDGSNALFTSATKGRLRRGAVEKMLRKATASLKGSLAGVTIRDLQMTAKARMVSTHGTHGAAPLTNVSSVFYFKRVYQQHAPAAAGEGSAKACVGAT